MQQEVRISMENENVEAVKHQGFQIEPAPEASHCLFEAFVPGIFSVFRIQSKFVKKK